MTIFRKIYSLSAIGLLILLSCLNSSCEKQLDNELSNATYEGAYWKNESDLNSAVAGAYGLFRKSMSTYNAFMVWGDAPANVLSSDNYFIVNYFPKGNFPMEYYTSGTEDWSNWYKTIALANLVIQKAPSIPGGEVKNYAVGEAYFLRALSYFYMTRVWGDVPLQTEAITSADQAELIGRTSKAKILEQVLSDASKASQMLNWEGVNKFGRIRGSKAAAIALLAHANAWKGDYAKTILYTDSLISRSDLFSLQGKGTITQVFNPAVVSQENIFVVSRKHSDGEAASIDNNQYQWGNAIEFLTNPSGYKQGMPYGEAFYYIEAAKLKNNGFYQVNDERIKEFFTYRDATDLKPFFSKYKYIQNIGTGGNYDWRAESNFVVYRLADIILLKSEALSMLNRDGEALVELNKIKARSGVSAFAGEGVFLKREIFQERERELVGEGHTFFDMYRFSRDMDKGGISFYPSYMSISRFKQEGYLFPILRSIVTSNRLIAQNTYWQNNK